MSIKFKLKPLVLAMMPVLMVGTSQIAYAQDSAPTEEEIERSVADNKKKKKSVKDDIEIIEVSGYRGSLQKNINNKRLSDSISDSIFAEDIGKSTDQNIADALSRITGVSVQQSDGEGTRISVRGAGANLNQISLNGIALTSSISGGGGSNSTSDQSVDLSAFSSDIIGQMSVVKTSAADHDEGSLGASVILKTTKPLNLNVDKRLIEVQGRHNQYADENDSKISGTFSQKLLDNTFGVIFTASKETNSTRSDSLGGDWLAPYEVATIRPGGATSLQTGQPLTNTEDIKGIISRGKSFNTNLNNTERFTATAGLQFLPSESTDVQLDISYSKYTAHHDNHRISTSKPDLIKRGNLATDPQEEWWTFDENNHTLVKAFNRYASGSLGRTLGGNESENKVATLTVTQYLTDNLTMDIRAGYSRTDYESLPNTTLSTATWNFIPVSILEKTPLDQLEPVGYDCSTGKCDLRVGTSPFIYVPNGINNNENNISSSGFNPLDPYATHLGYVAQYDEEVSDTNKSIFVDFDYDLDKMGITTVEFGAKWSNRIKDVYTNYQTLEGTNTTVFDSTGKPVLGGAAVSDIAFADVQTGSGLPIDDFMRGLIPDTSPYNRDYLKGWGLLDPNKAFEEIYGIPDSKLVDNQTGSRIVEQDNTSFYLKGNFEFLDSRLTGNIGVRYIKTKNQSIGHPSLEFFKGDRLFDAVDAVYNKQLLNTDLAACPNPTDIARTQRLDGFGADATDTGYPCFETEFAQDGIALVNYDDNGNVTDIIRNDNGTRSWWINYRHTDPSTQAQHGEWLVGQGLISDPTEIYRRVYDATGGGESTELLPSLNLNYAFSDKLIGRFATSKTMARAPFDDIRPGFDFDENVWGDFSRATVNNPALKPLTSKNIDLSLEWYFDQGSLLSIALFRKDMSNFVESVKDTVYVRDTRSAYELESLAWEDFIMPITDGMDASNSDCLPSRIVQDKLNNALDFGCEPVEASIKRNGKSTITQGIELTYNQSYDFLPGFWSGLGTNFNYTYANSESDAEVLQDTGRILKALPQSYTPKHTLNTTVYWEKDGHQLRLSHRYNSIQLVNRGLTNGAEWQDAKSNLDFSATYNLNKNVDFTFHALNLLNESTRTFYTSTDMDLGMVDENGDSVLFDEGNAMDGDADTSRTIREWKTGRQFRLSARITF
ncbi:TonB-dependent receptor [Colwellia sp. UCD-KL20]|uniref:TonB-dependent receptor n=1 Tax=Colwellia sp. UCD-KL20 TaxID=1917165 RepID=UPI0009709575|nr:TonB-dependent receptor [Colwellia sp. UCD-KL20]